jgi:hypothetical protein
MLLILGGSAVLLFTMQIVHALQEGGEDVRSL